eukprot:CAMPEP_0115410346 /NCGR_PEP_ID=MMETSP0271-20121206/20474_1 /TAXON_ID=71861 /ORGANISM="Scrippsiella trochoidea, Strain CCMP3099" /LENGTH=93 /DNA_ID=CAMNT_0002834525 /DNA_START=232 /DNA_END=513 /DNA_ORIENTATION=-
MTSFRLPDRNAMLSLSEKFGMFTSKKTVSPPSLKHMTAEPINQQSIMPSTTLTKKYATTHIANFGRSCGNFVPNCAYEPKAQQIMQRIMRIFV